MAEGKGEGKSLMSDAPASATEEYTLTAIMNIRKEPKLWAEIVGVAQPGTVVSVKEIKGICTPMTVCR